MAEFDSVEIIPRDIFVVGDEAAMEWTINAVAGRGGITFAGVDVFIFDDAGRITSVRAYWDRTRAVDQRSSA